MLQNMRIWGLLGLLASLLLGACSSYQMGTPVDLPYTSISIAPPKNFSTLPQIEAPLNAALRKAIQQSGALKLSTDSQTDAILEISILETRRNIAAVNSSDVGRGRKFELVIDLELSLRKAGTDDQYFLEARPLSIKQDIFADSGLVDAEYQAIPEVSRQIAERVAEILADRW